MKRYRHEEMKLYIYHIIASALHADGYIQAPTALPAVTEL
jgi:hypothetical protein